MTPADTGPQEERGAGAAWELQIASALALVAGKLEGRRGLQRQDVRALLLPLGALLADREAAAGHAWVGRIEQRLAAHAARFREVVASELELAAAEYVQGVDPRYLGLPGYDFEYTLESREGLEVRQLAAEALSVRIPDATAQQIELADRRLEAELERRGPPPEASADRARG